MYAEKEIYMAFKEVFALTLHDFFYLYQHRDLAKRMTILLCSTILIVKVILGVKKREELYIE
jgi:hypothetical protein